MNWVYSFWNSIVSVSNNKSEEVISQLTVAANNVVELYNRLNDSEITGDSSGDSADREDAVRKLELSIVRTHKVLHDCIFKKLKQNNGNIDVNQTDTVKKLNDLVTKGSNSHSSIVTMMEQYSDILLDMVQQKIHNSNMWSRNLEPPIFLLWFFDWSSSSVCYKF